MPCSTLTRALPAVLGLAALAGFIPWSSLGQSTSGTLHVSIRDKASGEVIPAIVCITSLADNTYRVPPDGLTPAKFQRNVDLIQARWKSIEYIAGPDKKWFPGDPGPVLIMNGTFKDNPTRDLWYYGGPAIPLWKEPAAYFVSRPFDITLPPGRWRISVMRGFEYTPVTEEFTVSPGQKLERNIQLSRWVDMARQGWYSGDPHVHSWRIAPLHDKYVITFAKAMDVHMTVTMNYCVQQDCTGCPQAKYGKAGRYHEGDYWVESGTEDPREGINEEGHVSQFDIQEPARDPNKYQLYGWVFDKVHEQGGLVGYDHLAWSKSYNLRQDPRNAELHPYPGWDVNINTIRGKVDFFSILQNNNMGLDDYYDFLNFGVKVIATASTDYPAPLVGEEATYAYTGTGGAFTPDAWYDAVRRGRTFVTNGPMLALKVGNGMPGDEVHPAKGSNVHVHAQAWAPESVGSPKVLEIVAEGKVIKSATSSDPKQDKLVADFDLPVADSQWIAARTTAFNGAVAHTTPVYVVVNGRSFIDRANVKEMAAKQIKVLDWIESHRVSNPQYTSHWGPGVAAALWKDIEEARADYLSLAAEPDRPPITGIADIAFKVSNAEAARKYYSNVLGYEEFSVSPEHGEDAPETFYYKVNDHQYIEIVPDLKNASEDKLIRVGFETTDARRLRDYLADRGVAVPSKVGEDACGNLSFSVKDPNGREIEFVQYLPDSIQGRNSGNMMPPTRLSHHVLHVGFFVPDVPAADKFYSGVLGFRRLWEGGPPNNPHAWISYLVPNGSDWLEYMAGSNPTPTQLGGMNHVALEVTDIRRPYELAITRGYTAPQHPVVARDGRWLNNFYDPDGSRTEFMIRKPVEKPCCTEMFDPFILR